MPVRDPKEVFLMLLSDARHNTERSTTIYRELGKIAENPEVQEALEARAFVTEKNLEILDECFRMIGEKPVKLSGRLHEVFVEDFKREFAEIQSPVAKRMYVLAKAMQVAQFRHAEYTTLITAADVTGHFGVGVLLESVLADKIAFFERTRRLMHHIIGIKVAEKVGERVAA